MQAGPGEHPLITDMQILAADISEQFDLMIAVRSKIRVAAFRGEGFIARPVSNTWRPPKPASLDYVLLEQPDVFDALVLGFLAEAL